MNLIDCISARSYLFRLSDLPVAVAETLTHNAYAFNIPPQCPPCVPAFILRVERAM